MRQASTVRINGADLFCASAGTGEALVFIHGFGLDHRMWDAQWDFFAGRCRLVRYDARGFGRSALPTGAPYSHAEDLLALLDHLGIGQAALVGFSMGAEIALEAALAAPQRVRALVLAGAFLHDAQWKTFHEDYARVLAAAGTSGIRAAKQVWLKGPVFKTALDRPGVGKRLRQMVADYSGWHFSHRDPQQHCTPPASRRLQQIQARTLVVTGEAELADFRAIAEILPQQMPRAAKIEVPGCGHLVTMEDADVFNRHTERFLGPGMQPRSP